MTFQTHAVQSTMQDVIGLYKNRYILNAYYLYHRMYTWSQYDLDDFCDMMHQVYGV